MLCINLEKKSMDSEKGYSYKILRKLAKSMPRRAVPQSHDAKLPLAIFFCLGIK